MLLNITSEVDSVDTILAWVLQCTHDSSTYERTIVLGLSANKYQYGCNIQGRCDLGYVQKAIRLMCLQSIGYVTHALRLQAPIPEPQPEHTLPTESPINSHEYTTQSGAADPGQPLTHKLSPTSFSIS